MDPRFGLCPLAVMLSAPIVPDQHVDLVEKEYAGLLKLNELMALLNSASRSCTCQRRRQTRPIRPVKSDLPFVALTRTKMTHPIYIAL